jgi:hypothetical protein
MSAANPMNVIQSFRNAGISLTTLDGGLFCTVMPETARCLLEREKLLATTSMSEEYFDDNDSNDDDNDDTDDDEFVDDLIFGPDEDFP